MRISKDTSRHWFSSPTKQRAEGRKKIIKEFLKINNLYQKGLEGKTDIKLSDYLFTKDPRFILQRTDKLLHSLEYLSKRGIIFPYNLKEVEAYLIGYCDGSGRISPRTQVKIHGTKKELERISEEFEFNITPKPDNGLYSITIPYPIARLYKACGGRTGAKPKTKLQVPYWAKDTDRLGKEYLAGRLDSQSSVNKRGKVSINITAYPDFKESHKKYLKNLANLTTVKYSIKEYRRGNAYLTRLDFSDKPEEIRKFLEEIPLRNPEKRKKIITGLENRSSST